MARNSFHFLDLQLLFNALVLINLLVLAVILQGHRNALSPLVRAAAIALDIVVSAPPSPRLIQLEHRSCGGPLEPTLLFVWLERHHVEVL